ncbi:MULTISPECIES: MCE family protein [Nocardia]|uniref:Virulence factor Mce-like protein n=1 Tax=Nocardia alba TaxID=225051 RepID=A0A4R1FPN9_9NOCA|nr:MCE family protein [Nocardia alba]TCJ96573.1 virulence factor Mce-like protein [Nocardia alba]
MKTPLRALTRVSTRRGSGAIATDKSLRTGLIAVLSVVLALLVLVVVNSLNLGTRTVRADFAQAAGIAAGDPVTWAGIPVGTVTGTRLAGDHVEVSLSVDDEVVLGADAAAAIKLTTLLGSRYVELRSSGGGELRDNRIPLSQTTVPYDLETALQDATTTFDQLDADKIAESMTSLSRGLDGMPSLVPGILRDIRSLSTTIATRRDQIGTLLTSTDQVSTVIRSQQAELASVVGQGGTVLRQIIARQDALRRLLDAITTLVARLEPIVVDDHAEVEQLLTDLRDMTAMMAGHDDLLRNILQILPVPWRMFANATGTGAELNASAPDGAFVDSWMCALSAVAVENGRAPYHQDCR